MIRVIWRKFILRETFFCRAIADSRRRISAAYRTRSVIRLPSLLYIVFVGPDACSIMTFNFRVCAAGEQQTPAWLLVKNTPDLCSSFRLSDFGRVEANPAAAGM